MDRKNELLVRVYLVLIFFLAFAAVISWKIIDISILEGAKWRAEKESKYLKWMPVKAQRGDIYSDDGIRMLASSIEFFEIRMDPVTVKNKLFDQGIRGLSEGLSKVLRDRSAAEWSKKIVNARKSGNRYILIAKKIDDEAFRRLKQLPIFEKGQSKGGLIVNRFYARKKTYNELASRTVGEYRDKNMVGIEKSYDSYLRGDERNELMRKVAAGLWLPLDGPTDYDVIRGKDVVTTIDVGMQDIAHHELAKGVISGNAKDGVVIIMDVKTGYIKAMSNLNFRNGEVNEIMNKAVTERSEPGSTFKAATALALLERGVKADQEVRIDKGKKKFYDQWMYDSHFSDQIFSDFNESFIKSSNVGIATLANDRFNSKKGRADLYALFRQFGLIDKTGIDLLGEPEPIIKNPEKATSTWSGVTVPWMAHGYELQITPLQMLTFYNAVANNGILMKPRLVKAIAEGGQVVRSFAPESLPNRIASHQSIEVLQSMMKGVVTKGTGRNIYTDEYALAGKTGTAAYDYSGEKVKGYNASFAGYFPADEPRYSMIVVVYGLKGEKYYGSQIAAPIFRSVADRVMALDGGLQMDYANEKALPRSSKGYGADYQNLYSELGQNLENKYPRWARIESEGTRTIAQKALIRKKEVPDVKGMGLRDAMYVLENLGMKVEAHGAGKVYKQSMRPGVKMDKDNIEIYLN